MGLKSEVQYKDYQKKRRVLKVGDTKVQYSAYWCYKENTVILTKIQGC